MRKGHIWTASIALPALAVAVIWVLSRPVVVEIGPYTADAKIRVYQLVLK